jgi:hypothetical protein
LIFVGLGAVALYRVRDLPRQDRAAVLVACSLFASPYALSYDLVALAPFAATVILRDKTWRGFCGAITYTAAFGPLSLLAMVPTVGRSRRSDSSS